MNYSASFDIGGVHRGETKMRSDYVRCRFAELGKDRPSTSATSKLHAAMDAAGSFTLDLLEFKLAFN